MVQSSPRLKVAPSTLTREQFIATYGAIYEHSPHFAETVFAKTRSGALDSLSSMSAAFRDAVSLSNNKTQLSLLRSHPDLVVRIGDAPLTAASSFEQSSAGLDRCTPRERDEFLYLNKLYKSRFSFPFIKAVRGCTRQDILAELRQRVTNTPEREFATAIEEIHKIALMRLSDLAE